MNKRLYVGNLSYQTTDRQLEELFAGAGEVVDATVLQDAYDGRSRGFGFVEMATEETAAAAVAQFNDATLDGRNIRVAEAKPRANSNSRRDSYSSPSNDMGW